MKKSLLLFLVCLLNSVSLFAQSYTIESTIGRVGNVGEKITKSASTLQTFVQGEFIYFLVKKQVFKTDKKGVILQKYSFPQLFFSSSPFDVDVDNFIVDKAGRFVFYESVSKKISCFNQDGTLAYQTKDVTTFSSALTTLSLTTDSKNNLIIGGIGGITVLNDKGEFARNIGKIGAGNGEFVQSLVTVFVDSQDVIYALNEVVVQSFDNTGKYLSKFSINNSDLFFDGINFYSISFGDRIDTFDKTGKVLKKTDIQNFDRNASEIVGIIDNNFIVLIDNAYTNNYYASIDANGNVTERITNSKYDKGGIENVLDFQLDKQSNLWIIDDSKLQAFSPNNVQQYFEREPDSFNFRNVDIITNVANNGDITYLDNSKKAIKIFNSNKIADVPKTLLTFKIQNRISYLKIDSSAKEIMVLSSNFFGDSKIEIYGFDGEVKRALSTIEDIVAMAENKNGNLSIIQKSFFGGTELIILDKTGKQLSKTTLSIMGQLDVIAGMAFDDDGILHIGVRHIEGTKGFAIYAIDANKKLVASQTNLAENEGNFVSESSYGVKFSSGFLYMVDVVNNQIFKLSYSNSLKKRTKIEGVATIAKNIWDTDFSLQPTSSSKAPFVYEITSGDAVSVSSTGLVKLLKPGKATIKISQAENEEFQSANLNVEITVNPKVVSVINGLADLTKNIWDTDFSLQPTSNSNAPFVYAITSGEAVSVNSAGLVKLLKPGKATIKISQAEATQFLAASKSIEITVNPKSTTIITSLASLSKKMGDTDFSLQATSSSNAPFVYALVSGDAVSVNSSGLVKILKAGKATVKVSQAEATQFLAAEKSIEITVTKKTQSITFDKIAAEVPSNSPGITLGAKSDSNLEIVFKVISGPATISTNILKPTGKDGQVVVEASQAGNETFESATSVTQSFRIFLVLSNELDAATDLLLMPNPAQTYIKVNAPESFVRYTVINQLGSEVLTGKLNAVKEINVEQLGLGIYLLKIEDEQNKFLLKRFLKN